MAVAALVPPNWQLPDEFRRRLGASAGRQRLMQADGQLLIVAHQVPAADEVSRRGILFWYAADGAWHASNGDHGPAAIEQLLRSYEKKVEEFDHLEARAQRSDEYLPLLEGLAPVLRASRNLLDVLDEARRAAPDLRELIDFRDRSYELARNSELLYQDAKNSMEVAVVRRAEEQAAASHNMERAAYRLNLMAALFFPLATLGAIFGTTLTENWNWSASPLPFALFLSVGLISGVGFALFINRR